MVDAASVIHAVKCLILIKEERQCDKRHSYLIVTIRAFNMLNVIPDGMYCMHSVEFIHTVLAFILVAFTIILQADIFC